MSLRHRQGRGVIGSARFSGLGLAVETNSLERANLLRHRLKAACGRLIRHRARSHPGHKTPGAHLTRPAPPEAEQLILDFKEDQRADWVDRPLPALQGRTPRTAVQSAQGRAEVELLLKEMKNLESHGGGAAFDFGAIRRELSLDES